MASLADGVAAGSATAAPLTGAESMVTNALPAARPPGFTVTTSVADWPACSVPWLLLSIRADDVLADQLTGPPWAVSVSWPVEPVPRLSWSGATTRVPVGLGVLLLLGVLVEGDVETGIRVTPDGAGADGDAVPGWDAATVSDSFLVADCWTGSVVDRAPADRLTLTGTSASAPPPG
jgi:hypothetical protein